MANFPALQPAGRSYDFGAFPLTEQPSLSAGVVRFRHSTTATDYRLTLEYVYLTDAEATQIRTHFQEQAGTYRSFQLPTVIWKGHTFSGNVFPVTTRWRYAEPPEETHHEIGRYSMTISLVSDGTYEFAAFTPVSTTFAPGGAVGSIATVTASLAAGAATGVVVSDPNFANVSLLLHMDGSNGSTTFTDNSSSSKTVTANGNAQISTTQSKFGGASGLFDGTGDFLSVPDANDLKFGTGSFTIELWFYIAGNSSLNDANLRGAVLLSKRVATTDGYTVFTSGDSTTTGTGYGIAGWNSGVYFEFLVSETVTQQVWHHLAISKSGSNLQIYFNGVQKFNNTSTQSYDGSTGALEVGHLGLTGYLNQFNGYIDDIRMTKGVARYTANFTPPAAAFPNS